MKILERFYPCRMENSTYEIPFDEYRNLGYRGLIFDIDNTLVPHGAPAEERTIRLFERLRELGFQTCLLSNNKEKRVKPFAGQVGSLYLSKGGKPAAAGYRKAMELMGTDPESTLFVGDQLFTDVYGANRAGLYSILVRPIDPHEEIQIVLKRYLEKPVLCSYRAREEQKNRKGKR